MRMLERKMTVAYLVSIAKSPVIKGLKGFKVNRLALPGGGSSPSIRLTGDRKFFSFLDTGMVNSF